MPWRIAVILGVGAGGGVLGSLLVPRLGLVVAVLAASVGLLIAPAAAPALGYVAGVLGTLLGADLLNLGRVRALGAPVVSIGGAGTFDGICLTGVIAVLIASL